MNYVLVGATRSIQAAQKQGGAKAPPPMAVVFFLPKTAALLNLPIRLNKRVRAAPRQTNSCGHLLLGSTLLKMALD